MSLRHGFRIALAAMLGLTAALLVSCGSSSDKLIPVASAGPLQSDFETVAQDAEAGNGNCAATESAILKTEQDFDGLPAALDSGLRETLRQGIENLRARALALCVQPLVQTTPTTTTAKTTTSTATQQDADHPARDHHPGWRHAGAGHGRSPGRGRRPERRAGRRHGRRRKRLGRRREPHRRRRERRRRRRQRPGSGEMRAL
jgi:hypothetical protein